MPTPQQGRREFLRLTGAGIAGTATSVVASKAMTTGASAAEIGDYPAHQPEREAPAPYESYSEIHVPADYESIQAAVDAAEPKTLILVEPGVYRENVRVDREKERINIRGLDRNRVILDGEYKRGIGVDVYGDDVVVENMTARNFTDHGFFWGPVDGFRGSYLTAYNNEMYGVYASGSRNGRFDNSYASGHTDAGFYNGHMLEGSPHNSIITDCVAEHNGLGFSGTNIAGRFTIKNSVWRYNKAGIVPNTFDSREEPPQHKIRIENNEIYANNNTSAPSRDYAFSAFGTGITIAGGRYNEIYNNYIEDHVNFGIALSLMQHGRWWLPTGNDVQDNVIENSGRADLALTFPSGGGNTFSGNEFDSSRPWRVTSEGPISSMGDPWATIVMLNNLLKSETQSYPEGDWRAQMHPDHRRNMPDVTAPPRPPVGPEIGGAETNE